MVVQSPRRAGHQASGAEPPGRHAQFQQFTASVAATPPGTSDAREPSRFKGMENNDDSSHPQYGHFERTEPYLLAARLQRERSHPG